MSAPTTEHAHPGFERLVAKLRAERESTSPRTLTELNASWHQRLAKLLRDDAADARALAARPGTSEKARATLTERAERHDDDAARHDELAFMAGA